MSSEPGTPSSLSGSSLPASRRSSVSSAASSASSASSAPSQSSPPPSSESTAPSPNPPGSSDDASETDGGWKLDLKITKWLEAAGGEQTETGQLPTGVTTTEKDGSKHTIIVAPELSLEGGQLGLATWQIETESGRMVISAGPNTDGASDLRIRVTQGEALPLQGRGWMRQRPDIRPSLYPPVTRGPTREKPSWITKSYAVPSRKGPHEDFRDRNHSFSISQRWEGRALMYRPTRGNSTGMPTDKRQFDRSITFQTALGDWIREQGESNLARAIAGLKCVDTREPNIQELLPAADALASMTEADALSLATTAWGRMAPFARSDRLADGFRSLTDKISNALNNVGPLSTWAANGEDHYNDIFNPVAKVVSSASQTGDPEDDQIQWELDEETQASLYADWREAVEAILNSTDATHEQARRAAGRLVKESLFTGVKSHDARAKLIASWSERPERCSEYDADTPEVYVRDSCRTPSHNDSEAESSFPASLPASSSIQDWPPSSAISTISKFERQMLGAIQTSDHLSGLFGARVV